MQFGQIVRLANQHCNEFSAEWIIEEPEVITIALVKTPPQRNNTWSEVVKRYTKKQNNPARVEVETVPTTSPKSSNNISE